ncbi:MAG: hypothetical protein ACR2N1_24320 [Rubripirellula sp.]
MRTLTLGVLIVSGGTLAALPFRRYHAIPDSSTTPVHATGPTNSALQMSTTGSVFGAAFAPPQMAEAILPGSILATHSENTGVSGTQQGNSNSSDHIPSLTKTSSASGGPLTYEDLVLPIEMPDIVQQRFNATAAVKSIQMEKERFANTDKSRMEPMTPTSADAPNSADTSLFASQSRNEAASRSVQQPTVQRPRRNQSAAGQMTRGTDNQGSQQLPYDAEPTLAAKAPARSENENTARSENTARPENTTGSLASASAARNTSAQQPMFANPADSEMLPATDSNRLLQRSDSPTRPRHWIRQPD